jgi:hypothetical protein
MPTLPGGFFTVAPTGLPPWSSLQPPVRRRARRRLCELGDAGAFVLNGRSPARSNGTFTARSFDGTTAGNATATTCRLQTAPIRRSTHRDGAPIPAWDTRGDTALAARAAGYYTAQAIACTRVGSPRRARLLGPLLVASSGDGGLGERARPIASATHFALADGTLNRIARASGTLGCRHHRWSRIDCTNRA